jgi:hypothetical protein
MADKDKIISSVYHDFYGSMQDTFREAKKKDRSITYDDVKDWFARSFVKKKNLTGYNSFIADEPFEEFQIDLFFVNDLANQNYKIGLLMIDIFSKYMTVVPLKTKQPSDVLEGIKKGFENMGEKPTSIYSDDEGAFNSKEIQNYLLTNHIQHLITRGHAPVAERGIRTIKDLIYRRMEKSPDAQWTDTNILSNALTTYNYRMVQRNTRMTPDKARNRKNILTVKVNLELHAKHKRKYPEIKVGDDVRIYTKKKNFQKERVPVWSEAVFEVEEITENYNQKFFHVKGKDKPYMRHEILLVPNSKT